MLSRDSSWDRFDGFFDNESVINDPLTSGDELASPRGSGPSSPRGCGPSEPESEPSPPPATAFKGRSSTSPPPPPAGSNFNDAQFYVVWLPADISGILIGQGPSGPLLGGQLRPICQQVQTRLSKIRSSHGVGRRKESVHVLGVWWCSRVETCGDC